MKIIFKNILKKINVDFLKVSFFNSIANILKMILGLINNKIVAIYLGPSGIAILGQFNNLFNITRTFSTFGILTGVTKYISEFQSHPDKQKSIFSTGVIIVLISSILSIILILIFSDDISKRIFFTDEYRWVLQIFCIGILFFSINFFLIAVLNGLQKFKKIIIINIATAMLGFLVLIPLVINYGLIGAFVSIIVRESLVLIITIYFLIKESWFDFSKNITIELKSIHLLFGYTMMAFSTMFATSFIQLEVRSFLIENLSKIDAGYWQGINKISLLYSNLITASMTLYAIPKFSAAATKSKLKNEMLGVSIIIIPLTLIILILIFMLREYIIIGLFSHDFMPMKNLFLFQFIGDFFRIISWILSYALVARGKTQQFIFLELFGGVLFYFLTIHFVQYFGIIGTTYAYSVNTLIYLLILIIIFNRSIV